MSHFYGTVRGNKGEASRQGTKRSGVVTHCASWNGAIRCTAWYDKEKKCDMVRVEKVKWQGIGVHTILYDGPIGRN